MCRCVGVGGRVSAWVGWVRGIVVIFIYPSFLVGAGVRGCVGLGAENAPSCAFRRPWREKVPLGAENK